MPFKLRLLLFFLNNFTKMGKEISQSPEQVRKIHVQDHKKFQKLIDFKPIEMAKIEDKEIGVRDGSKIPIRIYHPVQGETLPLIVFFHGGGFVTRSIESHDSACRRLAHTNKAVVVSVGYRLAPEHKFPIPGEDTYDATVWASENAVSLGADPDKLIVCGDSAGGNLAAVTCIQSRDLKGPKIWKQVLIYPTTDARMNHPSIQKYSKGYFLTKELMDWFVDHYKRTDEDKLDPLMSPYLTEDLNNLPPAYICTAEFDPLKDEGEAFAQRLKDEGTKVVFKEFSGMIHGFLNMPKITKTALTLHEEIREFIAS